MESVLEKKSCLNCQYYRPQTAFVDAYKENIGSGIYGPIIEILKDVQKEETRVLESEVELQFELVVHGNELNWPERPRFAPLCVASGGKFIPGLKNQGGHCNEFKLACNRQGKRCSTCKFVVAPTRHIGTGQSTPNPAVPFSPEGARERREIDREIAKANATAQAIEIEQAFYGDGRIPAAMFLPTCGVRFEDGLHHVVPFCNLRQDCSEHVSAISIPESILQEIGKSQEVKGNSTLLDHTIELSGLIAEAGPEHADKFLSAAEQWAKDDQQKALGLAWANSCVETRWLQKNAGKMQTGPKAKTKESQSSFFPVIAGCDALEWGLLAALSRTNEYGAIAAANAVCQQLAEFLVSVVSPFEAARCIDASLSLVKANNLFSPMTLEHARAFLRRLHNRAEHLRLVAGQNDLLSYLQGFLAGVSSAVAFAQRAVGLERVPGIEEDLQRIEIKRRKAQTEASRILSFLMNLDRTDAGQRMNFLRELITRNKEFQEEDCKDFENLMANLKVPSAAKSMIPVVVQGLNEKFSGLFQSSGLDVNQLIALVSQQVDNARAEGSSESESYYWSAHKGPLETRQFIVKLMLSRGNMPVTICALEERQREPKSDLAVYTPEEALRDPVARTVENFHAKRMGAPEGLSAQYFMSIRRMSVPSIAQ